MIWKAQMGIYSHRQKCLWDWYSRASTESESETKTVVKCEKKGEIGKRHPFRKRDLRGRENESILQDKQEKTERRRRRRKIYMEGYIGLRWLGRLLAWLSLKSIGYQKLRICQYFLLDNWLLQLSAFCILYLALNVWRTGVP